MGSLGRMLWNGAKKFNDFSVWNGAKLLGTKGNSAFHRAAGKAGDVMTSRPAQITGYYGMASMIPGLDLPGSQLAQNVMMPGWSALQGVTSAVKGYRMQDPRHQQALEQDVRAGAAQAGAQFLHSAAGTPGVLNSGSAYLDSLSAAGADTSGAKKFLDKGYKPMGWWERAGAAFNDPQQIIDNETRVRAQEMLQKGASEKQAMFKAIGGLISKVPKAFGPVLAPAMAAGGAYGLYDATFGSPYDRDAARTAGFDAANAGISKRLDNMSWLERQMATVDPTVMAGAVESKLPGSINAWEQGTGATYQPGLLGSFTQPGKPTFINAEGQKIS